MRTLNTLILAVLLALVCACAATPPAQAFSGSVLSSTSESGGVTTFAYSLVNSEPPGSAYGIDQFSFFLNDPVSFTATAPTGWTGFTDNETYSLWYTTDPAYDVLAGQTLAGFSLAAPGAIADTVTGSLFTEDRSGGFGDVIDAAVVVPGMAMPAATPEASAGLIFCLGVLILGGLILRKKSHV